MKQIKVRKYLSVLVCLLASNSILADEKDLLRRINDLESRILILEQKQAVSSTLWKDPVIWSHLKKNATMDDVEKLFGKPNRVEKAIFTTWYYHPASKIHSFVWFDEGKVLGWEAPDI